MLRDLHCHTLLKSNDSWDFLCLRVYGDVSENTWPGTLGRIRALSLVSDPELWSWLSGNFAVRPALQKSRKLLEGYLNSAELLKCITKINPQGQLRLKGPF